MITYAAPTYRPALQAMWKLCFPDTDGFAERYFARIYRDEQTLVWLEDDRPAASLQMIPYQIKREGAVLPGAYIFGAMTHPACRRRGFMSRLLRAAFGEMERQEIVFSFLVPQEPWLFDFYRPFGYIEAFSRGEFPYRIPEAWSRVAEVQRLDSVTAEAVALYRRLLEMSDNVVLKSEFQAGILLDEALRDGAVFTHPGGIALSEHEEGTVRVKELLAGNEAARRALLGAVTGHYHTGEVLLTRYTPHEGSRLYGMIKAIDPSVVPPADLYMSMMLD